MTQPPKETTSVHQRRLLLARSEAALKRNPKHCDCMVHPEAPRWVSKRRTGRLDTGNGAIHGAWHQKGCPHSTLADTTSRPDFKRLAKIERGQALARRGRRL